MPARKRPGRRPPDRKRPGRAPDRKRPHRRPPDRKPSARKYPHRQPWRRTSLTSRKAIRTHLQRTEKCRPNLTCATFRSKDPGSFLRSGSRIPSELAGSMAPLRRRRSAFSAAGWRRTTVIQQRLSICRRSTCRFLPTLR